MLRFRIFVGGAGRNHDRVRIFFRELGTPRIPKQPTVPAQSSRTLLSMRKRMRPSSRGPFSAIGWYLLPGPAYCGCFGYAAYFAGVLCTFIPAVPPKGWQLLLMDGSIVFTFTVYLATDLLE